MVGCTRGLIRARCPECGAEQKILPRQLRRPLSCGACATDFFVSRERLVSRRPRSTYLEDLKGGRKTPSRRRLGRLVLILLGLTVLLVLLLLGYLNRHELIEMGTETGKYLEGIDRPADPR